MLPIGNNKTTISHSNNSQWSLNGQHVDNEVHARTAAGIAALRVGVPDALRAPPRLVFLVLAPAVASAKKAACSARPCRLAIRSASGRKEGLDVRPPPGLTWRTLQSSGETDNNSGCGLLATGELIHAHGYRLEVRAATSSKQQVL